MFLSLASIAPSTAASRSASSKTKNGALPPSSIEVLSTCFADCSSSRTPTAVEPVKVIFLSLESEMIGALVAAEVLVVITFRTPAGSPASSKTEVRSKVVSGVSSAGLITMVQPAAIAGPIFLVAIANGKFQGVIAKAGPTGRWVTSILPVPSGDEPYLPEIRTASSENQRRNSLP